MIKQFFLLSAILGSSLFASSHWDEEQIVDYVHHSELQRRSSWHLLSQIKSEFADAVGETMQNPHWRGYFQDFQSTFRFESLEAYVNYFKNAGFFILHAQDVPSVDPFVNRVEAIN